MVIHADPRPDVRALSDEDLMVELGTASGSMTALQLALERHTVKQEARAHVQEGVEEWQRRMDRCYLELARRGYLITEVDPRKRP